MGSYAPPAHSVTCTASDQWPLSGICEPAPSTERSARQHLFRHAVYTTRGVAGIMAQHRHMASVKIWWET
eukprot:8210374-Pyramimonas_sp.AAC.2